MKTISTVIIYALLSSLMALSAEECSRDSKPWREIASGSQSNIEQATRQVIQNQEQWRKWWEEHIDGKIVPKPAPKVDFEQETVLAATLGRHSTGGYAIRFTEIRRQGDQLTAVLQTKSPGSEDMVTMALTSPFAVIATPKHTGRVEFIEKAAK